MTRLTALFRNLFRQQRNDSELDDELRAFVDLRTDELVARGMAPAEARRAALLECGGVEQVKEAVRDVRAGALIEQCVRDVLFALRMLRKNPGFTAVAVLTIALGVGANISIFTAFTSAALQPLALPEPHRLVAIYQTLHGTLARSAEGEGDMFSHPEYRAFRASGEVLSGLAAYMPQVSARLDGDQQEIKGQLTSCNYFEVMGVKPVIGRGFSDSECDSPGSGAVVVIADRLWRDSFNSDPAILGKVVRLNRTSLTVIGVAAPHFQGTELTSPRFWAPLSNYPTFLKHLRDVDLLNQESFGWLALVGRLKDGMSVRHAQANLDVVAARIDASQPGRRTVLTVDTATYFGRADMKATLIGAGVVVLVATGLVLLIACANLANFMLARASVRSREMAVRLALGATRGRLVRQLLTESLLVAAIGGALGLALSIATDEVLVKTVMAQMQPGEPPPLTAAADVWVFIYAAGLTLLTGVAFGLAPALQESKTAVIAAIKQVPGIPEPRRRRLHGLLVGAQVAMCMVLLMSAGLLLRGLYHAQRIDPGYDITHHAIVSYALQREGYSPPQASRLNRAIAERLRALPGVERVTPVLTPPLSTAHVIGQFGPMGDAKMYEMRFNVVGAGFFSSLGAPLVRGREFNERDVTDGAALAILNEAAARQLSPGENPIGKRVHGTALPDTPMEVVGVVADVEIGEIGQRHTPYIFVPATGARHADTGGMLVRTEGTAARHLDTLRAAARSVDPAIRIEVGTIQAKLAEQTAYSGPIVALAAALAGLAMLLAAIGIYGTVALSVTRRVREIGIRIALGARRRDVLRAIVRTAMRPVLFGSVIGAVASAGAGQILRALLYGISPFDAIAYASVAAFLFAVAALASYLPARRALRIDPIAAIRHE